MKHHDFVNKVVELGLEAAKRDYSRPDQKQKLDGAIAGFESCYNKSVAYLKELLRQAETKQKAHHGTEDYWYYVCFSAEVEWVCNCVSAVLVNAGVEPIIPPTAKGTVHAAAILNGQYEKRV